VRIALTHAFCWPEVRRGAERFLAELGPALVRRGHEVWHYSSAWDAGLALERGVRMVRLPRRFEDQYRHERDFGRRLLPRLAGRPFDAVHSLGRHDAVASLCAARLRGDGRRTVMTDLGLPDRAWWRSQGRREALAAGWAVRAIDVYSGMSRAAVQALAASYGRGDGVVVPGGVDLTAFAPAAPREPAPTILFSGAIAEPRKGIALLLEAVALIAQSAPAVRLWLSGPGDAAPLLAHAPAAARERTIVLGVGEAGAQHERYGRAWATCLPSTYESFGMALLESLACGTPLVTTTHAAPKELVEAGVTGELCRPGDPDDLAQACLRAFALAGDPQTARRCRDSAAPYDWDGGLAPLCEGLYGGLDVRFRA
jgi:phosphatidylinositol alpha-mannosyltransferase